jgi:transcriptional regulator with XRE-family HTH domain
MRDELVLRNHIKEARTTAGLSQAQLAEMVGTSAPHISRLINKKDGIVNKVFVEMLEKLGYDIQITYAKKEE